MIDLGTLGGVVSVARGINNSGGIVGASTTLNEEPHAFYSMDGSIMNLGTLGGLLSVAYGINNSGQIVGYSLTAQGQEHAFLDSDGSMGAWERWEEPGVRRSRSTSGARSSAVPPLQQT